MGILASSAPLGGNFSVTFAITSNKTNYDLHADLIANHGWDGIEPIDVDVTLNSGIVCKASTTSAIGFNVIGFPVGSSIVFTNNGEVTGRRGIGGAAATAGSAGGLAFKTIFAMTIDNTSGELNGGGGGGGGGGNGSSGSGKNCTTGVAGLGGDGYGEIARTLGTSGSFGAGNGGKGGDKGAAGANGTNGVDSGCVSGSTIGGLGGIAGGAVDGDSNITWTATGIRNGAIT
jgi:hypothetical protein